MPFAASFAASASGTGVTFALFSPAPVSLNTFGFLLTVFSHPLAVLDPQNLSQVAPQYRFSLGQAALLVRRGTLD